MHEGLPTNAPVDQPAAFSFSTTVPVGGERRSKRLSRTPDRSGATPLSIEATDGRAIGLADTASVNVRPDAASAFKDSGSAASARRDSTVTRTIVRPLPVAAG